MRILNFIFVLSCLSLDQQFAEAQDKFVCSIEIPAYLNKKQLRISYNNDLASYKQVKLEDSDSTVTISDSVFTKYVAISMNYIDSISPSMTFSKLLFVSKGFSNIRCIQNSTPNQLTPTVMINGIDSDSIGGASLKRYVEKEQNALNKAYATVIHLKNPEDSIIKDLFSKGRSVNKRTLDFITSFPTMYFSMWAFRTHIILDKQFEIDSLVNIFSRVFPDSLKNTSDGAQTKKVLFSRMQAKIGSEAVNFSAKTVSGKKVSSNSYRGKYLLLDFWASWCVPCIKQIPKLEYILSNIDSSKISVLAISHDSQYKNFVAAVKKYKMKWEQVYGNSLLPQDFAVVAIPQVILINDQGKVIYNMEDQNDYTLSKFKAMIDSIFR